ncbi:MAG: 50S rRNA methyltransferase, partial [Spirochaetia bacterium]|nr:50S rRNA methyltransferase [Spirochaetia bacterium]
GNIELYAIDLSPIEPFREGEASRLQGSVYDLSAFTLPKSFHLVLSDMAPSTTGSKQTDSAQSFELAREAGKIASRTLEPGGFAVVKYLQGSEFQELQNFFKKQFSSLKLFKPKSSRKNSTEIFFVASR